MTLFKMFGPLIGLFLFMIFIWIVVSIGYNSNYYSVHAYDFNKGYKQLPIIRNDPSLKIELVFKGLDYPTSMAFLGADDILVLEKNNGTVQRIVDGNMLDEPVLDVNVANKLTRGILGIDVASNSTRGEIYVFLYYTESSRGIDGNDQCPGRVCNPAEEPLGNRLYKYELRDDKLVSPKLLLDLPATSGPSENGGPVRVGPDKNVYLVIGGSDGLSDNYVK